ncbi:MULTISPECIES: CHAT domain-containing protein [Nostoc]|uniref:CHAT domain-containing protein n=2 Tax=Nostoc TaxID=1177 RepID=A0ABR8IG52_9NOSO|nr:MULTISPECIES: CHAT domain-containing protein [Nostoc]MBD2564091.1 CHAT domain-containing protein [Nostoc linckia FACHB-391]MBD2649832.1 CHAT domain-containing protein [Nostoc foliaceum FACHB-393]
MTTAIDKQKPMQAYLLGLQNLGDVLRLIGKLDVSYAVLKKAFELLKKLPPELKASNVKNQLLLSLANTERSLYYQAKNKYQLTDEPSSKQNALLIAQSKLTSALTIYQDLSTAGANGTDILAKVNLISLLLEIKKWSDLTNGSTQVITIEQSLQILVEELLIGQGKFQQLSPIESVHIQLNLAQALIQINQDDQLKQLLFSGGNSLLAALSIAKAASFLAQELDNKRAKSYALGTLGNIYNYLGQTLEAKQYLEAAMRLAQSVQAWDIAYQWQWQLGRLYQQIQESNKAIQSYAAAINSLNQVRGSILAVNPEIQLEFKEKIEPVYQEYMELLLSQDKPIFKQVVKLQEQLKLVELENFLQCGQFSKISLINSEKLTELPSIIYLIKLKNRVEIIVRTLQGTFHKNTVEFSLVSDIIDSLVAGTQKQEFTGIRESNFLIQTQSLYNSLFAPIKKYLPDSGNLVFILDTYFQNLPLSILHDGENYLLKHYSISISLSSDLWQSQSLNPKTLKALVAGISEIPPSFKNSLVTKNFEALPEVKTEIANIKTKTAPGSKLLLNAEFTSDNFRQNMEDDQITIIHLSTHGQFSSDAEKTFVLAWNVPLIAKELNFLLKTERSGIDLLVLSACQTAKGDRRSALGIAGIAAQAGAGSILASLWLVEANSTGLLMSEFYKGLINGMTKAEALRQAQLKLISNPKYSHPYFWAGFILVGNWL